MTEQAEPKDGCGKKFLWDDCTTFCMPPHLCRYCTEPAPATPPAGAGYVGHVKGMWCDDKMCSRCYSSPNILKLEEAEATIAKLRATIAAKDREIARLEESHRRCVEEIGVFRDACEKAEAALAESRADTERLAYLDGYYNGRTLTRRIAQTWTAAIDEKMAGSPNGFDAARIEAERGEG